MTAGDDSIWDGSPIGWRIERHDDDVRIEVSLPAPVGELDPKRRRALRGVLGEAVFFGLSAADRELFFVPPLAAAEALHLALGEAGFESTVVITPSFSILHEVEGGRSILLVEGPSDAERLVARMLAAGVPFVDCR